MSLSLHGVRRLVIATHNPGKAREIAALLEGRFEAVTAGALGLPEPEETEATFGGNALLKARAAAEGSGLVALADDSGLSVRALGGAPGVLSARYAPWQAAAGSREDVRAMQDAANNRLLLDRMQGMADRRARFVSALVAVRSADDPEPLVALGRWQGTILEAPRGTGGFGYDPLMFIASLERTVAELGADVKNRHSHRAIASQQMLALMREVWHLG